MGECFAFKWVALAAVAGQFKRVEPVAERLVEAAGADRRQLGRVADQQQLPFRPVDRVEKRGKHARLGHPRLVGDQHAAVRKAGVALDVEEQPVHGAAGDAGGVLELVGRAAARRRTQHRGVDAAVGEGAQRQRLSGAGDADDADDAVGSARGPMDEHPLLAGKVAAGEHQRFRERASLRRGHSDVAASERQLNGLSLDIE